LCYNIKPNAECLGLCLGPHLFVKVPRPGDSEVTFAVLNQAATLTGTRLTSLTTQR